MLVSRNGENRPGSRTYSPRTVIVQVRELAGIMDDVPGTKYILEGGCRRCELARMEQNGR